MNIIPIASRSFERIRWSAFFLWNVCLYWPAWAISSFLGRIPVDYNWSTTDRILTNIIVSRVVIFVLVDTCLVIDTAQFSVYEGLIAYDK